METIKKQKLTERNKLKLEKLRKSKHDRINQTFGQVVRRNQIAKKEFNNMFDEKYHNDLQEIEMRERKKKEKDRNASVQHQNTF